MPGAPLEKVAAGLCDVYSRFNPDLLLLQEVQSEQALAVLVGRLGMRGSWIPGRRHRQYGLAPARACVCSCDEGIEKPAPEIFRLAARRSRLASRHVLYVGDDLECDVRGARAAGWDSAMRRSRYPDSAGLALFEFDDSAELAAFALAE